jgi:hypothetical protein
MQTAEQRARNGRKSRNKGKAGEREVIQMLQPVVTQVYELFDLEPPRLQRNSLQSDGGGSDIHGLDWMALEVKFCATPAVEQWWAQTTRQAGRNRVPILFYRTNNQRWRVVMFGMLGTPSVSHTCRVTVEVADFVKWFRQKLTEELS